MGYVLSRDETDSADSDPNNIVGSSNWYYMKIKNPVEITDVHKIKKYKMSGLTAVEDTDFVAELEERIKIERKAEQSEDPRVRNRWGLILNKEDARKLEIWRKEQKELELQEKKKQEELQ